MQAIKKQELEEWKKRTQCEIQQHYGHCLSHFGDAHIAACDASCEETEQVHQKRKEYDLMAAQRGRSAMLQEQRKRDRALEDRLAKKNKRNLRNTAVQADLVTSREVGTNVNTLDDPLSEETEEVSDEEGTMITNAAHKSSTSHYNPAKYVCNSVDSSNNCDSEDQESFEDVGESEAEFNQISNFLRQKRFDGYDFRGSEALDEENAHISKSSEEEIQPPAPKVIQNEKMATTKKGILKKPISPKKKPKLKTPVKRPPAPKTTKPESLRVKYVDFANKYTTTYAPNANLVIENQRTSKPNARNEASIQAQATQLASEHVLR